MYKNLKFCLTFYNHVSVLTWRRFLSNVTYPIHLLNIHRLQNRLVYHHIVIYPRTLMLFQFDYQDQLRKEDYKKKMINLNKIWVKISATMVGRRQKIKKKTLAKTLQSSPKNTKFGPKYIWFKLSYLEFFFKKYYFGHKTL